MGEMREISIWRIVAVLIIAGIWIAFSYGVAVSLSSPVWVIGAVIGGLWLVFVVIAYFLTKDWSQ